MNKPTMIVMMLAGVSALGACSKSAPEELPPPPSNETTAVAPADTTTRDPVRRLAGPGTQEHFENAVG